jgi:hypothetical protein
MDKFGLPFFIKRVVRNREGKQRIACACGIPTSKIGVERK